MSRLFDKLADMLFGKPDVVANENGHPHVRIISKTEFERKIREQEWRRKQIEAEVRPWLEA